MDSRKQLHPEQDHPLGTTSGRMVGTWLGWSEMAGPSSLSNPGCSAHPLRCQQSCKHQMCVAHHSDEAGLTAPPQQLHRNEMGEESDEDSVQHLCMKFKCPSIFPRDHFINLWNYIFVITQSQSKEGKIQGSNFKFYLYEFCPSCTFFDLSLSNICFFTKLVNGWYLLDYIICCSQKEALGFEGELTGPLSGNVNCTYEHSCQWRGLGEW